MASQGEKIVLGKHGDAQCLLPEIEQALFHGLERAFPGRRRTNFGQSGPVYLPGGRARKGAQPRQLRRNHWPAHARG